MKLNNDFGWVSKNNGGSGSGVDKSYVDSAIGTIKSIKYDNVIYNDTNYTLEFYANGVLKLAVDVSDLHDTARELEIKFNPATELIEYKYDDETTYTTLVDLSDYQKGTDNTLKTTDKTIVGSINEIYDNFAKLPSTTGTDGQVLKLNASGELEWSDDNSMPELTETPTGTLAKPGDVLTIDSNGDMVWASVGEVGTSDITDQDIDDLFS